MTNEIKLEIGLSEHVYESLVKFAGENGSTIQKLVRYAAESLLHDLEAITERETEVSCDVFALGIDEMDENACIRELMESEEEASNPETRWFSHDEVFAPLRVRYGYGV